MKLPAVFPEGTVFLDVDGVPVTAHFEDDRYLDWEDREAATPRAVSFESIKGRGKPIREAAFRELVHRAHTCALPALLVKAAKDLHARRRDYAELKAQGLTEDAISAEMHSRIERRRAEEPEALTVRTIAAARRSARGVE